MRSRKLKQLSEEIKEIKQFKEQQNQQAQLNKTQALVLPEDLVVFVKDFFGFQVKDYQAELLRDKSKRIVVRWSRQAAKTALL